MKRELLLVGFGIILGAGCLWGFDIAGLLSKGSQVNASESLQIDFPEVYRVWKKGEAVFVDSRSGSAFKRGHIPGAINVPLANAAQSLSLLPEDRNAWLIIYCSYSECPIGHQLANLLRAYGYRNVHLFRRGIQGWLALGYQLEKGVSE